MKGFVGFLAGAALLGAVAAPGAFAQSSGNFSYGNTGTTHCVLNNDGTGTVHHHRYLHRRRDLF
jgi:hypothetical protein